MTRIQELKDDITDRGLHIDGIICVCDDSGGEPITSFTDEAAVKLFRRWLGDERKREEREQEAAKCRSRLKLITNMRPKNVES